MAHKPNAPDPRDMLLIKLVSCLPQRASGLFGSERVALLTVRNGTRHLAPMAIRLPDVRSMVSALIYVLICQGDEYGLVLARAVRSEAQEDNSSMPTLPLPGVAPFQSSPTLRKAENKKPETRPSRRPSAPRTPVSELEAWKFLQMLRNVKSHQDFMGFVGAEALPPIEKTEDSPRNKPQITPQKRLRGPKSKKKKEK